VFEAPAFVAGFDNLAVVREPIEESGGHLGVAEDAGPFGRFAKPLASGACI